MNKFVVSLLFVILGFSLQAQSQNHETEFDVLVQRIDSLEHQLSYLKLTYELNTLKSDIMMFGNEIDTKSISIQLDLYSRNFSSRLGNLYLDYYKSCLKEKESFSELIETKKNISALNAITYSYTESEVNTLKAFFNLIQTAYDKLEYSLNLLKETINIYRECM